MKNNKKAVLVLEDGTVFTGKNFGWEGEKCGEVVFNTSLTGYEEILTDPSYCGQIVAMCYPHIGNYGINFEDAESYKIWVEGFVVREYSKIYSNARARSSLCDYLKEHKVVGIEGIDTRALVRIIRQKGAMKGIISAVDFDIHKLKDILWNAPSIKGRNLAAEVNSFSQSVFRKYSSGLKGDKTVAVIDYGVKLNIIRHLEKQGLKVIVLPGDTKLKDLLKLGVTGAVLSNGPGDPQGVSEGIELAGELIKHNNKNYFPVLGICLGHQLIGLGSGGRTYKLKFGHHGGNHPVKNLKTAKIEITVQNHNFCVDPASLTVDFEITHVNLNDHTPEGMKHKKFPIVSYQYHPESGPGPHDCEYIFSEFRSLLDG